MMRDLSASRQQMDVLAGEGVQGEGAAVEPPCLAQPWLTMGAEAPDQASFPLRF